MRSETGRREFRPVPEPVEDGPPSEERAGGAAIETKGNLNTRLLWGIYLPPAILLMAFFLLSVKMKIPFGMFSRDPAELTHSSPFLGVMSNIGILFWCSAAAICMLSFLLLRKDPGQKRLSLFFLASSIITIILMMDDLFMFHEKVYYHYFDLRQRYIYLAYFTMILGYLFYFRKTILKSPFMPLVLAFMLFGMSILVDGITDRIHEIPFHHLLEDGPKFLGIAGWLGYFGTFSLQKLSERRERSP